MNQLRQDAISREWVVFAPGRAGRPSDVEDVISQRRNPPVYDRSCPFCPGNERMLDDIVYELPGPGASGEPWSTRVVNNRYPAFTENAQRERRIKGRYTSAGAHGRHEVVIESPVHNEDIPVMSLTQVAMIVQTYRDRYRTLMEMPGVAMITIFRNHGIAAGTSLTHPHSQIIAAPVVSAYVRSREEHAQRHFDDAGKCIYCAVLEDELDEQRRIVAETDGFAAFVPFAAQRPFETWILPRRHSADFGSITDAEAEDLAGILITVLGRMAGRLDNPDYNYVVHSGTRYRIDEPHLHWYVQISPRLLTRAGFEIGSGFSINPYLPEENARILTTRA